jgi:tetratricopeptide (TPR) repeat protein
MELFYNPERMSETEIKETFVAYQWVVDEIISIIKRQPKGAGVQHVVIVAPRGMGKTTLLLMLRFTVLSQDIAKRWQPVLFPEESYSVYDLADLWVEVIDHVASETGDVTLGEEVKKLKDSHPDSSDLESVALASIKDWRKKNKKRLLLLIDNFDMILEQIGSEKDNASLRDVLMNDGTMMLVGGSTIFFKEARAYDQPLYNLFKIYNLNGLNSEQVEDLLRRRARIDGLENFEEILRANRSRLRVLEYFTGGNPRLVLMLYRVLTHSDISEVRRGLEKLLDEVTPYYKAKIEVLPPQQRKILDQIARISAETREGLTPTEIAGATRLPINQVSSQLKRLADVGYVRAANIRGRSSYYTLSEPLYAIWHQMRFGRNARTRMNWLIAFLRGWYDAEELGIECQRLHYVFRSYLVAGREHDARNALEHRRYLMEAIEDPQSRVHTFESIVLSYLELSDVDTLKKDILVDADMRTLSEGTLQRLLAAGVVSKHIGGDIQTKALADMSARLNADFERLRSAKKDGNNVEITQVTGDLEKLFAANSPQVLIIRVVGDFLSENIEGSLINIEKFLEQKPELRSGWSIKGLLLKAASRLEEAVEAFKRAIEIEPDFADLYELAKTLKELGNNQEALAAFDRALHFNANSFEALYGRALVLGELGKIDEALSALDYALTFRPNSFEAWYERGSLLASIERIDQALESFDQALKLNPNSYRFLQGKCWALMRRNKVDEALKCVNMMLELEPDSADAYLWRGLLTIPNSSDSALNDLKRAFDLKSSRHRLFVDTLEGKSLELRLAVIDEDLDQIKHEWPELLEYATQEPDQTLALEEISTFLIVLAENGHWARAQELINSAGLDQPLLPLSRALEYLLNGDESIIERLSPEIRTIVNDIVIAYRNAVAGNRTVRRRFDKRSKTRKVEARWKSKK